MFNGKTHYKLPFSIAMLNYQRVQVDIEYTEYIYPLINKQLDPKNSQFL